MDEADLVFGTWAQVDGLQFHGAHIAIRSCTDECVWKVWGSVCERPSEEVGAIARLPAPDGA